MPLKSKQRECCYYPMIGPSGPKGDKGDQGIQGSTGEQGPPGDLAPVFVSGGTSATLNSGSSYDARFPPLRTQVGSFNFLNNDKEIQILDSGYYEFIFTIPLFSELGPIITVSVNDSSSGFPPSNDSYVVPSGGPVPYTISLVRILRLDSLDKITVSM